MTSLEEGRTLMESMLFWRREATIEAAMKYNGNLGVARRGCAIGSIEDNSKRERCNAGINIKVPTVVMKPDYSIRNLYGFLKEAHWLRLLNHGKYR